MTFYGGGSGGGGGGVARAAEGQFVVDSAGITLWMVYDENTGSYDYFNAPGGTSAAPSGNVKPLTPAEAPKRTAPTDYTTVGGAAGSVLAGTTSVSILNKSPVSITVKGSVLESGQFVEFTAPPGATLDAIAYDASAAGANTIVIAEVR